VDPGWSHKANSLIFMNSLKMKTAVVLGVIQMTFGIFLSLSNHLYFKDKLSIWFEFVPRLTFMICTFGYMIFMIVYKTTIDWTGKRPPGLINTMIQMFLSPGVLTEDTKLYHGQVGIQVTCLVLALVSVPIMLCCKPCMHNKHAKAHPIKPLVVEMTEKHKDEVDEMKHPVDDDHEAPEGHEANHGKKEHKHQKAHGGGGGGHGHGDGPYSFSDDLIHQSIHTIEFVLGTVSNTASYLRLWALSLAHAQLAEVFWNKMLQEFGYDAGAFNVFLGFAVWAAATTGVLLLMDVLECFLHALRLHWVEFQNKFYYADGYIFRPFTLEDTQEID